MAFENASAGKVLLGAAAVGLTVGVGSVTLTGHPQFAATTRAAAVAANLSRARPPQAGDSWGGCNDARAAGTAPIYRDEPGYRSDMDGDDDGIACEPVR